MYLSTLRELHAEDVNAAHRAAFGTDTAATPAACTVAVPAVEDAGASAMATNVQVKPMPWELLIANDELLSSLAQADARSRRMSDLVLIASLVDKIPNLGGLCRTCEVFGVRRLVVGSLAWTETPEFRALSMSADRWVTMEECREANLPQMLIQLRRSGYTIVGIEQTEGSRPLQEYRFPAKCALVLGSEAYGLPVSLLQMMDACVEVPQYGLVRSLNVHVTGALCMWEYTKQNPPR
jgi:tRNA guanosine-2'-O-methyltransferase